MFIPCFNCFYMFEISHFLIIFLSTSCALYLSMGHKIRITDDPMHHATD